MTKVDKSQQKSGPGDVEELVEAMKAQAGASSDAQLASILGVERSAVSQWKRRGKVPKAALLKVSALELAATREGRFSRYLASLPQDVVFYGKALATLYCAKSATYRVQGETVIDPERLRQAVTFFDELCAAGAYLIDKPHRERTAWEGFTYWANSQFLVKDMWETHMLGKMAHLANDAESPQSESSIHPDGPNSQ